MFVPFYENEKCKLTDKIHACLDKFHYVCKGCLCIPEHLRCTLVLWILADKYICTCCRWEGLSMCRHSCRVMWNKDWTFRSFSRKILQDICIRTLSAISRSICHCFDMVTNYRPFLLIFHKDSQKIQQGICIESSLVHLLWGLHKFRRFDNEVLSNMGLHDHKILQRNVTCSYEYKQSVQLINKKRKKTSQRTCKKIFLNYLLHKLHCVCTAMDCMIKILIKEEKNAPINQRWQIKLPIKKAFFLHDVRANDQKFIRRIWMKKCLWTCLLLAFIIFRLHHYCFCLCRRHVYTLINLV